MLATIKGHEVVEVDLGAVGLHLQDRTAGAVPHLAGELAVFHLDFDRLPFLALGTGFVGGVGDAGPSACEVLGGKCCAEREGESETSDSELHHGAYYIATRH